jgi:hypothetical protein
VDCEARSKNFSFAATTALGIPAFQIFGVDCGFFSAIAKAKPFRDAQVVDGDEVEKALIGDIDEFGQRDLLSRLLCQETASRACAGPFRLCSTGGLA